MKEIILDTALDSIKILPFLFIAFLIIELFEHKLSHKTEKTIKKAGKLGPLIGSLLGAIPQCGFSVLATNLYITRIISLGTLISIYLSTSDEMIPILKKSGITIAKDVKFAVGDMVKVISETFYGQEAVVEKIDFENQIVTVLIDMFGRQTPNELRFDEVELIK